MSPDLADQPQATIPRAEAFADIYAELLDLVDDYLERPVTASIDAWEDGTYRIKIYHVTPGSPDERELLYYHSADGEIVYGVEDGDTLTEKRVLRTPEPGATGSEI